MEAWVAISVGAAFLQNVRSGLQRALTPRVGVLGATYARFLFAAPLAVALVAGLALRESAALPGVTAGFAAWGFVGAAAQIAATALLLRVFSLRNFAVGNTFAKTETVQAALFGLVLLGDRVAALAMVGIVASLAGIVLVATIEIEGRRAFDRAAGLGLLSGAAFALSAVAYRAATLALADGQAPLLRPAFTLACVTLVQTVLMTGWLALSAPGAVVAVVRAWPVAVPVGAAGMLASLGWFTAFTLATAAEVKAVGQVELLFSWLTARYAFGELPSVRETLGIALVAGGIVLVVLSGSGVASQGFRGAREEPMIGYVLPHSIPQEDERLTLMSQMLDPQMFFRLEQLGVAAAGPLPEADDAGAREVAARVGPDRTDGLEPSHGALRQRAVLDLAEQLRHDHWTQALGLVRAGVASRAGPRQCQPKSRGEPMTLVFIQLRCRPGRTYEVADAIYDLEFVSELYSTSGEYDLLLKVYIPDGEDIGHFINGKLLDIPNIDRSLTTLTFKAF